MKVAVIGSGAAGLAAAWRLNVKGARVVIFERNAVVGGLLHTADLGGARVDTAVQLVSSTYTRLFALAKEAGVGDLLVRSSGEDALWRKGRAHEITYGSVPSMIASAALPTMLKLKLGAKYVPFLTLQAGVLDANDTAGSGGAAFDRESVAAWGAREMGDDFVEYMAYPLLAAYYGSTPENTSAAFYHALARVGMDVRVFAARGGMGALSLGIANALQSRGVELRTSTAVSSITASDAGDGSWAVHTSSHGPERFDAVVVATPPDTARELLANATPLSALTTWLGGATTRPAATLGVVIDRTMRAPYFGISFPRTQTPGDRIVAIALQQNKPAGLVPAGKSAMTIFPSPAATEEVARMSAADALEFLRPSIDKVFPGVVDRPSSVELYAGNTRYRGLEAGFVRRIQELRALTLPRGFALAGDYTMGPTVEGAVRSGERAAAALLA